MNDAAERLQERLDAGKALTPEEYAELMVAIIEPGIRAAERRATVERIRAAVEHKHPYKGPHPRLQAYSPGPGIPNTYIWRPDLLAILDAEAER